MTIKEMAKECKKIWNKVAKTGNLKENTNYKNDCPACQYALDKSKGNYFYIHDICKVCPLRHLWGKDYIKDKYITPCEDSLSSPYRIYKKSLINNDNITKELRKICATMIINYLTKKYKV